MVTKTPVPHLLETSDPDRHNPHYNSDHGFRPVEA